MYVEHKAPGEVAKPEIKTLADAIRVGAQTLPENKNTWQYCALGTAAKAVGWDGEGGAAGLCSALEDAGILPDPESFNLISRVHYGGISRLKIADMLDRGEL